MVDHLHHGAAAPGLAAPQRARVDHPGLPPLGAIGAAPGGLSPPLKDEAPELAGVEGFGDQGKADTPDSADDSAMRKHLSAPCTCGFASNQPCLSCRRWRRHYRAVVARQAVWRAVP